MFILQLLPQSSFSQFQVSTQLLHVQMRYCMVLIKHSPRPLFVDLSPEFVDLFAGCFDHSHLVSVEIVYLSVGVGDLSAGVVHL